MAEEFIDLSGINLEDTYTPTVVETGTEAELRIVSFMKDKDKNGKDFIMPFFEIVDEPYAKEFGDYMPLPSGDMSPKELNNAKLRLIAFSQAFDINLSGTLDIKNDVIGKKGWAILGIGKDKEKQPVNKVNKYVTGA